MVLLFFPMLFIAVSEMAGIALVLPVIQVLLPDAGGDNAVKKLLEYLPEMAPEDRVFWVLTIFVIFFITKNILYVCLVYLINWTILSKNAEFISEMFVLYLSRPMAFHLNRNSAEVLRDLLNGSSQSFEVFRQILLITLDSLIMLGAFILLVMISPTLTLAVAAFLIILAAAFYLAMGPVFHRWGARVRTTDGRLIKWISQSLSNIRDTKLMHAYGYLGSQVNHQAMERAKAIVPSETAIHIPRQTFETIIVIGFLAIVLFLGKEGRPTGEIMGILGLYGMAAIRLLPSLTRILTNAAGIRQRVAYVDGLHSDMIEGRADADWASTNNDVPTLPFEKDIRLSDVRYSYGDNQGQVLDGIDLTIRKGESIGFVGPSGAGKTTLIDIVIGLLKPKSGDLLIDGVDAFTALESWQKHLGYVPQSIYLLDDTLRRNIAFGIEDDKIDELRLADVISHVGLDDVVAGLANGLDTEVGEFGTRVSGGQRQRVAIARSLYRNPDVLVFDEATSALDNETEREITAAIENLSGDKTILIIAHRLSTVRNCDRLVFMKAGRIKAIGTYEELCAASDDFRRLAALGDFDAAGNEV